MDAAFNLGILFAGRGDDVKALVWYERAAAAGHTEAALQVAIARLRDGDERAAERHLRCAMRRGQRGGRVPAGRGARRASAARART